MEKVKKKPGPEIQEIDVADLKSLRRKTLGPKNSRGWVPRLAPVFGLAVAVSWHFLHQADEIYRPSPDDPHFWFHLVVEGTIALYAALFYLVIWKVWQKFK